MLLLEFHFLLYIYFQYCGKSLFYIQNNVLITLSSLLSWNNIIITPAQSNIIITSTQNSPGIMASSSFTSRINNSHKMAYL